MPLHDITPPPLVPCIVLYFIRSATCGPKYFIVFFGLSAASRVTTPEEGGHLVRFLPGYLKLPCCSITLHPTNPRSCRHPHTSPRGKCLFRLSIRLSQHLRPRAVEIPRPATLSQEYPKIHLQTPVFVFIVMQPAPPPCCIILY